jgi:16S rRNA (guanine(966)-N(2))-methyltransferase RsmD
MVRQTIFNVLQNRLDLRDSYVLDLFSGTGSLGLEALSRGAAHATFVDSSETSLDSVESAAEAFGCLARCAIIRDDAMRYIGQARQEFDLIFADPPYAFSETASIPQKVFTQKLLKKTGFLIIEHGKRVEFPKSELFSIVTVRKFGQTLVNFFSHPS